MLAATTALLLLPAVPVSRALDPLLLVVDRNDDANGARDAEQLFVPPSPERFSIPHLRCSRALPRRYDVSAGNLRIGEAINRGRIQIHGHGLRERHVRGPLGPGEKAGAVGVSGRRYLCVVCGKQ